MKREETGPSNRFRMFKITITDPESILIFPVISFTCDCKFKLFSNYFGNHFGRHGTERERELVPHSCTKVSSKAMLTALCSKPNFHETDGLAVGTTSSATFGIKQQSSIVRRQLKNDWMTRREPGSKSVVMLTAGTRHGTIS